ncbi:hypothetical protein FLJU110815_18230 [Flavobacterium jumunjinense]
MNSCKEKKDNGTEESIGIEKIINHSESADKNEILTDSVKIENDSIIIPEFVIKLELSEKAENKLTKDKESVIVQAYFSGIPKDTLNEDYEKWGKIHIGGHNIELWNSKIASFKNIKISKEAFNELADPNFEVLINVFSGRHSTASNLLDCEIIQESIDSLRGKTHLIKGKLIFGE